MELAKHLKGDRQDLQKGKNLRQKPDTGPAADYHGEGHCHSFGPHMVQTNGR